jgi:hypothetical protein
VSPIAKVKAFLLRRSDAKAAAAWTHLADVQAEVADARSKLPAARKEVDATQEALDRADRVHRQSPSQTTMRALEAAREAAGKASSVHDLLYYTALNGRIYSDGNQTRISKAQRKAEVQQGWTDWTHELLEGPGKNKALQGASK